MPDASAKMFIQRRCHQPQKNVKHMNSIEIDYYILESQISLKQLQMQPFKHPCAL